MPTRLGQRERLLRRRDVVARAGQDRHRAADPAEVDPLAVDLERAGDELVALEQVLHDPEVERARDVLRPLEPVLELRVPAHVVGVAQAEQQVELLAHLVLGASAMKPPTITSPRSTPPPAETSAR